jgi:serine protease Do
MGALQLRAHRGEEKGHIVLTPRSPLATEVQGTWTVAGKSDVLALQKLHRYIMVYLTGETSGPVTEKASTRQSIPEAVLSKLESVVCLKAKLENDDIQFSGFILDEDGLILSTAHEMNDLREITVVVHDGRELKGKLIKLDARRDLAFIDVDAKFSTHISMTGGRNMLGMGEWIYSVGCPNNLRGSVHAGIVNGPPRKADELPLWQVSMEIYPGSSGSPVFDQAGNLVAVVKGRYRGTGTVGFLIPFETIVAFAKDL